MESINNIYITPELVLIGSCGVYCGFFPMYPLDLLNFSIEKFEKQLNVSPIYHKNRVSKITKTILLNIAKNVNIDL